MKHKSYNIRYLMVMLLVLIAVAPSSRLLAQPVQEKPRVRFLSPRNDDIWIGEQKIEVQVKGVKSQSLGSVSIYLDGKLVKEFTGPPFRIKYNFGQMPKNQKLEALVKLKNNTTIREEILSYHLDDSQEVEVLQVVVPAVVTDRRGNYVSDLTKDDFIIIEDGVEQEISYFSKSGRSTFHLVLLIDISSSMRDKIQKVKEVAKQFLRQLMTRGDKAIIVFFNHEVFEDSDFTSDINELDNALSIAIPFGATALYDAVAYSVKLMKSIIGHNIIILLSDGEDNSSAIDPYTLMNIVERSNSVIYSIGKKEYMNSFDQYQEILQKISVSSGGMTFFLDDVDEVRKVYEKIRRDIKAKFLIRFSPKDKERRNRFRKIEVKVKNHKGYKVRTMKGYFY
ncbi:MAG: VWA domain-containing protein [Candidatus Aminicenantes bacterium]